MTFRTTFTTEAASEPRPEPAQSRAGWKFIEQPKPVGDYHVSKAISEHDLTAVNTLWNAVYGEECGWLRPAGGARYLDRYHPHSTYLVARVAGRPVGTMRLVVDSSAGLPIEQFVSIHDLRGSKALVECQRLMILREFRNQKWPEMPYGVLGALFKACLHWCITNSYSHIIADLFTSTPTTPIGVLLSLGFEETGKTFIDTELDEPCESIALLLKVGELFSRPFRTDTRFFRYLMDPDEHIDVYS